MYSSMSPIFSSNGSMSAAASSSLALADGTREWCKVLLGHALHLVLDQVWSFSPGRMPSGVLSATNTFPRDVRTWFWLQMSFSIIALLLFTPAALAWQAYSNGYVSQDGTCLRAAENEVDPVHGLLEPGSRTSPTTSRTNADASFFLVAIEDANLGRRLLEQVCGDPIPEGAGAAGDQNVGSGDVHAATKPSSRLLPADWQWTRLAWSDGWG